MRHCLLAAILGATALLSSCATPLSQNQPKSPALAHNVYFTLNDNSPDAQATLVKACYKYLRDHPGVTFFAAGRIVEAHAREVNVRDWDVSLHVVFQNQACHDLYQKADSHLQFIEENKENWKTVRVFDTYVE